MCTKPIRIRNNAKYIAEGTAQQMYIWINCGHCKECITAKQNEWNLRTYYETLETLNEGNWVYFDTLTYRNKDLPRVNQFAKELDLKTPCFNYKHIREFYETLRGWYGDKSFKYFITSEYGDIRHRPHYHILLFVKDKTIDKIQFSADVAEAWKYGRTDGRPYKSKLYVLNHNIIENMNLDAIRYVSKYVTKSEYFNETITAIWNNIETQLEEKETHKLKIKAIKRQFFNATTPFHRQSQHYGESALCYMDYQQILDDGRIYYRTDNTNILQYIPIPTYFKRKLWQKQIKYNGKRIWINTEEGIRAKKLSEQRILENLITRLDDLNTQREKHYEDKIEEIAYYILFERGRLSGTIDYKPHHEEAKYFNYNTDKDLKYLGEKTISKNFAGNDKIGYCKTYIEPIDLENEIYINNEYEAIINDLMVYNDDRSLVLLKEHMNEIRKIFFPKM